LALLNLEFAMSVYTWSQSVRISSSVALEKCILLLLLIYRHF